jgi:hypothetical protein
MLVNKLLPMFPIEPHRHSTMDSFYPGGVGENSPGFQPGELIIGSLRPGGSLEKKRFIKRCIFLLTKNQATLRGANH